MRTLNLGVLAHVDAGKTTLTERLLHAAGVIDEPGSVDAGSTQTDSLALERRRGITIKAAVVSFAIGDVTINLIDTPGHPDFIAEVERALGVLDGAVLVVSAVEGVQAQTRVLMRALQRLRVPTLLFINKTDRRGADPARVLDEIADKLTPGAEAVEPVFAGSARTGEGVPELMAGIATLLPAAEGDAAAPASGTVFKVERGPAGEKLAYVRMRTGAIRVRDRLAQGKVTAVDVFDGGAVRAARRGRGGRDRAAWGLDAVRIGDAIGAAAPRNGERHFAPPTLETVVVAAQPDDRAALRAALTQLAEQDPLIDLRQDEGGDAVSLYGEVQKEVIAATLAEEYGVEVVFRATTTICIERPVGSGAAVELLGADDNPFLATVGLRVDPAAGHGVTFGLEVELGSMPPAFFTGGARRRCPAALRSGLRGWAVPDCAVTMTHSGYAAAAEPFARDVRQEHVEHRRRLPRAGGDRGAARARSGGYGRVRARAPVPAGDPGRRAGRGLPGARAARRGAGHAVAARGGGLRARGRHPGRERGRAAPPAAVAHPRRGLPRNGVRPHEPVRGAPPRR